MLHPNRLNARTIDDATACPPAGGALEARSHLAGQGDRLVRARSVCLRWLVALGAALARAERHITENFKVPPHGG